MIQLIAGGKGAGKTKTLIALANASVKNSEGHVVFIDDDRRHIFDLSHDVRFVETVNYPLSNYREFVGFVCGILSQDNDIVEVFIDGLSNVIKNIDNDGIVKLLKKFEQLNESHNVSFVASINCELDSLPEEAKKYVK
ncbi:MAG: twitching motility protein PilT [Clostridiales bacterium]|jgi:hypothetical protein|nr:twitching motility protein PilT [Clostridiales bacterium]